MTDEQIGERLAHIAETLERIEALLRAEASRPSSYNLAVQTGTISAEPILADFKTLLAMAGD